MPTLQGYYCFFYILIWFCIQLISCEYKYSVLSHVIIEFLLMQTVKISLSKPESFDKSSFFVLMYFLFWIKYFACRIKKVALYRESSASCGISECRYECTAVWYKFSRACLFDFWISSVDGITVQDKLINKLHRLAHICNCEILHDV